MVEKRQVGGVRARKSVVSRAGRRAAYLQSRVRPASTPTTSADSVKRAVEVYLADCRARGLAARTIEAYSTALQYKLLPWLQEQGIERMGEVSEQDLGRLAAEMLEHQPLARESVRTYLRHIGFFLTWWAKEDDGPRLRTPSIRSESRIAKTLTPEQMQALQLAPSSERDRLMLQLLCETGVRASELLGLRTQDILADHTHRRYLLHIRGKGARDRRVPISPALYRRISAYISRTRPEETFSDRVFLAERRSPRSGRFDPLEVWGLRDIVIDASLRAGLEPADFPKLGPHLLRKSFTRMALKRGMDSEQLRAVLGHVDTRMIREVYGQLQSEDAYESLMKVLYDDRRR